MNELIMRFPEGRAKVVTFSYDDGVIQDERLINLFKLYEVKGTFNLNSGCFSAENKKISPDEQIIRVTERKAIELYTNSGMEVALHTKNHPGLAGMKIEDARKEVREDKEKLELMFNRIISGMAYPFGSYNAEVIKMLKEEGVAYSRTVEDTEGFSMPVEWLSLAPTCHHNSPNLMKLAHQFVAEVEDNEPLMLYIWGHAYEFDRDNNWHIIEELLSFISKRENIWYATNLEIYEYVRDFNRLIISANGRIVQNPTARIIYFQYRNNSYRIKPNEVIHL